MFRRTEFYPENISHMTWTCSEYQHLGLWIEQICKFINTLTHSRCAAILVSSFSVYLTLLKSCTCQMKPSEFEGHCASRLRSLNSETPKCFWANRSFREDDAVCLPTTLPWGIPHQDCQLYINRISWWRRGDGYIKPKDLCQMCIVKANSLLLNWELCSFHKHTYSFLYSWCK